MRTRVKGSALAYTTLILIVIIIVVSMMFLKAGIYNYYQSKLIRSFMVDNEISNNFFYLLYNVDERTKSEQIIAYTENNSIISLSKEWGLIRLIGSKNIDANQTHAKIAFAGYSENATYTLYLVDEGTPLTLCGKTKIVGNVSIPASGVKRVNQNSLPPFAGFNLIDGKINVSKEEITESISSILRNLTDHQSTTYNSEEFVEFEDLISVNENSFFNNTKHILCTSDILISNISLHGNFIIESRTAVIVDESANIEDVIIKAPKIILLENFVGSLQCFATDSIIVSKNSKLKYPSVLCLHGNAKNSTLPLVFLDDSVKVNGLIIVEGKHKRKDDTMLILNDGCTIQGQILCDGLLSIKGSVYGSVSCRKFILLSNDCIYMNYIHNAQIEPIKVRQYINVVRTNHFNNIRSVIKWVF